MSHAESANTKLYKCEVCMHGRVIDAAGTK